VIDWVVVPQDKNREDLMDLDGIHVHTSLNHTDSHCLKFKTNAIISSITKFIIQVTHKV